MIYVAIGPGGRVLRNCGRGANPEKVIIRAAEEYPCYAIEEIRAVPWLSSDDIADMVGCNKVYMAKWLKQRGVRLCTHGNGMDAECSKCAFDPASTLRLLRASYLDVSDGGRYKLTNAIKRLTNIVSNKEDIDEGTISQRGCKCNGRHGGHSA